MGLFDRNTDMSDGEPSETDDEPAFEPVAGTGPDEDSSADDSEASTPWPPDARLVPAEFRDDDFSGTLKRAVDEEAGVVLYAYANGNAGGLTAVPIDRTRLADE
ncbi:hypothetical protein [Halorarum halobium]|uniref:hypothetical protein n=1 Tax=Halorarum halobium TaxID=3075121 RepID=UPI0028AC8472|nr:hypothetical protein [Halobaculum sp. XH14]